MSNNTPTKVLVVDDEPDIVEFLKLDFEDAGFEVFSASGGDQAIAFLDKDSDIGVVVTDMKMPKGDGDKLAAHIKEIPEVRRPKVFMISGHIKLSDSELKSKGIEKMYEKPLELRTIIQDIIEYLVKAKENS